MTDWRDRIEQFDSREEWLKARRTGIGASEWAAILNVDGAFRSAFETWADKTGKTELETEVPEFVQWGARLEPMIAAEFSERIEKPVVTYDNAIVRHPDYPWLYCSPDAHVGQQARAGGELKNSNAYKRTAWFEGVPLIYQVQCIASMFVTGLETWWIAALIGGNELVYKKLEYDEAAMEFVERAFPALERFWKRVEADEAPTPKGTDGERKILTGMFPQDVGTYASLPHDHRYVVQRMVEAMATKKEAESVIEGAKSMTRLAMGEHTYAVIQGLGQFSWKTAKNGVRTLRWKELK
ncbi:MAG: YqaJ viral recombinase family protein [Mycobacterium sp.]